MVGPVVEVTDLRKKYLPDTMVYGNEVGALANLVIVVVLGFVFFLLASRWMSWKER